MGANIVLRPVRRAVVSLAKTATGQRILDQTVTDPDLYLRPGGVDQYKRPGGSDDYHRPEP